MLNGIESIFGPPLPISGLRFLIIGVILQVVASVSLVGLLGSQTCSLEIILLLHFSLGWIHLQLVGNLKLRLIQQVLEFAILSGRLFQAGSLRSILFVI